MEAEEEEEEEEKEKKKKKNAGHLATFWFSIFAMFFHATGHVVDHQNTQR